VNFIMQMEVFTRVNLKWERRMEGVN